MTRAEKITYVNSAWQQCDVFHAGLNGSADKLGGLWQAVTDLEKDVNKHLDTDYDDGEFLGHLCKLSRGLDGLVRDYLDEYRARVVDVCEHNWKPKGDNKKCSKCHTTTASHWDDYTPEVKQNLVGEMEKIFGIDLH